MGTYPNVSLRNTDSRKLPFTAGRKLRTEGCPFKSPELPDAFPRVGLRPARTVVTAPNQGRCRLGHFDYEDALVALLTDFGTAEEPSVSRVSYVCRIKPESASTQGDPDVGASAGANTWAAEVDNGEAGGGKGEDPLFLQSVAGIASSSGPPRPVLPAAAPKPAPELEVIVFGGGDETRAVPSRVAGGAAEIVSRRTL